MKSDTSAILHRIDDLEKHKNSTEKTEVKNKNSTKFLELILYLTFLFWFLMNIGFAGSEMIAKLLMSLLTYIKPESNVLGLFPVDVYIAAIAFYILIMFYLDIFLIIPYLWLTTVKESATPRIVKNLTNQLIILVILIMFTFITTTATTDGNTFSENANVVAQDTQARWERLQDGPFCYLFNGPEICMAKEKEKDAENIQTEDFTVRLTKPPQYFTLKDLKERKFYLDYRILAKGEGIQLEKLECYVGNVNEKPVFTLPLSERPAIKNNNEELIDKIYCDFNNLTFDKKIDKEFKVIPVLYYKVKTSYSIQVPFYNMDKYLLSEYGKTQDINIRNDEEKFRKEYGQVTPVMTNNALLFTSSIPTMPIFIGEYYKDDEYRFTYTFTKNIISFGDIISSNVINNKYPSFLECISGCDETFTINTYDGKSNFQLNFKLKNQQSERDFFTEDLSFTLESQFKKKDAITLVVENTEYIEPVKNSTSTNSTLSAESKLGSADPQGIYTYNADSSYFTTPLYYKKTNDVWQWSPDKINWMNLSQEKVIGGDYEGETPTEPNLEFIRSLK